MTWHDMGYRDFKGLSRATASDKVLHDDGADGSDLKDVRLISKYNKVFRVLLYVIKFYRKYPLFVPLKWKKQQRQRILH